MKFIYLLNLLVTAAALATPAEPLWLENGYVRVGVDRNQGGAVTSILYKKALTFPFIADRGAGVAGSGELFAPVVSVDGKGARWLGVRVLTAERRAITLFSSETIPGLEWERRLRLGEEESGFTIEDVIRNNSDHEIVIAIGASSRQRAENWRLTDRSWIGNGSESLELLVSRKGRMSGPLKIAGDRLFWRQIEQYGTGFIYQLQSPPAGGVVTAEVLPLDGHPVQVAWQSGAVAVPAHGSMAVAARVSIDEGGGAPDQRNAFAPVLVRSDFAAAGRSGQPLVGHATVVSDEPRRVRVAVLTDRELTHEDLTLLPGKVARVPVTFTPPAKGNLAVHVIVSEHGDQIGAATAQAVIDGDSSNQVWRTYAAKMPEEYYHGTWEQIGEQLASDRHRIVAPTTIQILVRSEKSSDSDLQFYRSRFPYYTDMLAGISKVMGVRSSRLILTERADPEKAACMDVACYGPDGPINAYSKERNETSFAGLGYAKIIPKRGYPFHTYMHFGINAAGLSISGASLDEDPQTDAVEAKVLADWKQSGKHLMPSRVGMWMLLSMCRDVDEALAMISNPEAPLAIDGEGSNWLLVDRAGNAARVESVGIAHQIFRRNVADTGFFVAGNYPHPRADGLFQITPRWGGPANTMLREQFLREYAGSRQGHLSVQDVVALMQTHEAGGMCQHIYDNPGVCYTSCSSIAVTRTGDLWLSQGPPCDMQYVRHTLTP